MTLHPRFIPEVPDETVKVAKAAFRKGNRYMQMRDELGTLQGERMKKDGDKLKQKSVPNPRGSR